MYAPLNMQRGAMVNTRNKHSTVKKSHGGDSGCIPRVRKILGAAETVAPGEPRGQMDWQSMGCRTAEATTNNKQQQQ